MQIILPIVPAKANEISAKSVIDEPSHKPFNERHTPRQEPMEIHSLHVLVTEQDLNELAKQHMPKDLPVEDMRLRLSPEGVHVTGVYPFFISVKFETIWHLSAEQGKAIAQLTKFRAMGVPGNIFKSAIMKMVEDIAKKESWVKVAGDQLIADPDQAMAKYAVAAKTHLKSIIVQTGLMVIEAGY